MSLVSKIKQQIKKFSSKKQAPCNICGKDRFIKGPGGRLSSSGIYPRCLHCYSLERHRLQRTIAEQLLKNGIVSKTSKVLQFSNDPVFDASWFDNFEISVYNGTNSIDIQAIDRPDHTYSLVVANHVIEHVPDDLSALKELIRITEPHGLVFLSAPQTSHLETTDDWGYAKSEVHGHYRHYGKDITTRFLKAVPGIHWVRLVSSDPATQEQDDVFLLSKSQDVMNRIQAFDQARSSTR